MAKKYGKWKLTGKSIGQGGQAQVLEVIDSTSKELTTYAIKILTNNKRKERLDLEISVSKSVHRQGAKVIEVIDDYIISDQNARKPWYVMPILQPLPKYKIGNFKEALSIFKLIAEAVIDLHNKGVTHRDLKPDNIFYDNGKIVLGDLGLCLPLYDNENKLRLTGELERIGSIHYTPQEAFGKNPINEKQRAFDLYALGKILYQLISGKVLPGFTNHLEPEYNLINYIKGFEVHTLNLLLANLLHNNPEIRIEVADYIIEKIDSILNFNYNDSNSDSFSNFKISLVEAASKFAEKSISNSEKLNTNISLQTIAKEFLISINNLVTKNPYIVEIMDVVHKYHNDTLEIQINENDSQIIQLLIAPYTKTHYGLEPLLDLGRPKLIDFETGLSLSFKSKKNTSDELFWGLSVQVKNNTIYISGGIVKKNISDDYIDFLSNSTFLHEFSNKTELNNELQDSITSTLQIFANQIVKLLN